jgi:molecular chaperone HscA
LLKDTVPTETTNLKPVLTPILPNLNSIGIDRPESPDILLCLDFGTAMSKAFATDETDDNLVDLKIGQEAGQSEPIYSLISSIFITDSGRILFGHRAVSESTHADTINRKRFDSIKDILCKDVMCDLDEAPLETAYNPTNIALTKGDMVTLFLAYFTDMATSQLQANGYSRYVSRRFTRPVLPPDRGSWAENQLRALMVRAQILADTLHGGWHNGIDVKTAKQVLTDIRNLEVLPTYLIDSGVIEPVAAVGSRFRSFQCKQNFRRLLMVIDVGAGTIDYALFAEVHEMNSPIKIWEIPGSVQVLRQAGDMVDKLLRSYILKKANVVSSDNDFLMIDADLSLRIRQLKEQLFCESKVNFSLTNDQLGQINLSEFIEQPAVKEFEKLIHEKFFKCLTSVHKSWVEGLGNGELAVVFTGGGATLPMIRSIEKKSPLVHDRQLQIRASVPVPLWVKNDYPELSNEFLQLAVAIGGASRSIPILAPKQFSEFKGLNESESNWSIPPVYKGI